MPLVVPRANVAVSSSVGERTCIVNASDGDGYQSENEGDLDEGEVDFTSVILSEIWRVDFKGGQRLYRVQYDDKSKKDVVADRFDNNGNANDRQTVNDWRALCEENGKNSPWPRPENSKVIFPPIINARMLSSSFMSPYAFFPPTSFLFSESAFPRGQSLAVQQKKTEEVYGRRNRRRGRRTGSRRAGQ